MPVDDAASTELDGVLEALANPHRRAIVYQVGLQPYAISQLAEMRGLTLPAIHRHILILEAAGVVTRRKRGRTTYVTLNRRPLQQVQDWAAQFHPYWGSDEATYENYEQFLGVTPDSKSPRRPTDPGGHQ